MIVLRILEAAEICEWVSRPQEEEWKKNIVETQGASSAATSMSLTSEE
jgi:hypothetical protein